MQWGLFDVAPALTHDHRQGRVAEYLSGHKQQNKGWFYFIFFPFSLECDVIGCFQKWRQFPPQSLFKSSSYCGLKLCSSFFSSSVSISFLCPLSPNPRGSLAPALRTRSPVLRGASYAWWAHRVGAAAEEGAEPLQQSVRCLPLPYGAGRDWCFPPGSGCQRLRQKRCFECLFKNLRNGGLWILENGRVLEFLCRLQTDERWSRLHLKGVRQWMTMLCRCIISPYGGWWEMSDLIWIQCSSALAFKVSRLVVM